MTPLDPDEARELPEPDLGTLEPGPTDADFAAAALGTDEADPAHARCPRCNSPDPKLHPAVQFEGEVQICDDPWHGPRYEVGPWGWQCEDCDFFTDDEASALLHSDSHKHSLARCPKSKRKTKAKPTGQLLTPQEEANRRTRGKRRQRKRQKERQKRRIRELESQLRRTLSIAAQALERVGVSTDASGAAAEAEMLLEQVVTLSGEYVPYVDPGTCDHIWEVGNGRCKLCRTPYPDVTP